MCKVSIPRPKNNKSADRTPNKNGLTSRFPDGLHKDHTHPNSRNRDFEFRLQKGLRQEQSAKEYFKENFDLDLEIFGVGREPKEVKEQVSKLHDNSTKFLRHLPDTYCVISDIGTIYVEVKHALKKTGNFSINLDEFNTQNLLHQYLGVRILFAFAPSESDRFWRGDWIQNLDIKTRAIRNKEVLENFNGSRKPCTLIEKKSLPHLDDVVHKLLNKHETDAKLQTFPTNWPTACQKIRAHKDLQK